LYTIADGQLANERLDPEAKKPSNTSNEDISGLSENFGRGQPVDSYARFFIDRPHVADSSRLLHLNRGIA